MIVVRVCEVGILASSRLQKFGLIHAHNVANLPQPAGIGKGSRHHNLVKSNSGLSFMLLNMSMNYDLMFWTRVLNVGQDRVDRVCNSSDKLYE